MKTFPLKYILDKLLIICTSRIERLGLENVIMETSLTLMLKQNTGDHILCEMIETELTRGQADVIMCNICSIILDNCNKYEELFHKGWDFKDIVEDVMVEKNLHF